MPLCARMKIYLDSGSLVSVGEQPKWSMLFPLGVTRHREDFPDGKITFDAKFLASMVMNWNKEGKPERVINFNHAQPGQVPYKETVAAGWIQDLKLEADGLYALIKWTDEAKTMILADQFRYLSPEFATECMSKETGSNQGPTLFGAALLNTPFLVEMPKVAASEQPKKVNLMDLKKLAVALGLPDSANEEDVMKQCAYLSDFVKKAQPTGQSAMSELVLASESAKVVALNERVTALEASLAEKTEKLEKIETEKKNLEVKNYFDDLVKKGIVPPAHRQGLEQIALANGLESVKFLSSAPAMVSMTETGVAKAAPVGSVKEQWEQKVQAVKAEKKISYREAVNFITRTEPTLTKQALSESKAK